MRTDRKIVITASFLAVIFLATTTLAKTKYRPTRIGPNRWVAVRDYEVKTVHPDCRKECCFNVVDAVTGTASGVANGAVDLTKGVAGVTVGVVSATAVAVGNTVDYAVETGQNLLPDLEQPKRGCYRTRYTPGRSSDGRRWTRRRYYEN